MYIVSFAVIMAFIFCLKVEFSFKGQKFQHCFSPESSYLLRYADFARPFHASTCIRCYNAELFPHFKQDLDVNDYFGFLDFDPENWLSELADYLPHLKHRFHKIPKWAVDPVQTQTRREVDEGMTWH